MKDLIASLILLVGLILILIIFGCGGSATATSGASATGGKATVKIVNGGVVLTNPDGSQTFVPSQTADVTSDGGTASGSTSAKTDGAKIF